MGERLERHNLLKENFQTSHHVPNLFCCIVLLAEQACHHFGRGHHLIELLGPLKVHNQIWTVKLSVALQFIPHEEALVEALQEGGIFLFFGLLGVSAGRQDRAREG